MIEQKVNAVRSDKRDVDLASSYKSAVYGTPEMKSKGMFDRDGCIQLIGDKFVSIHSMQNKDVLIMLPEGLLSYTTAGKDVWLIVEEYDNGYFLEEGLFFKSYTKNTSIFNNTKLTSKKSKGEQNHDEHQCNECSGGEGKYHFHQSAEL